ncbi:putative membrane protein [Bacillus cereus]|nr:putative membrane protein [Bacillus cereus]
MEKLLRNKSFHMSVKIIGFTIIFCSVALLFINVICGNELNVKGLNKKLGTFGEYGAILAASLWFLRHVWLFFKKKNIIGFNVIKNLYLFIKKFHVLIGYTVLAVSITHGIYFL